MKTFLYNTGKLFLAFSFLIVTKAFPQTNTFPSSGSAGIGTVSPNTSSVLDMVSTTQGVLVPRMTKAERNGIASPATGLLIYQTNGGPGFYFYNGSTWTPVSKGANKDLSNLSAPTAVNADLLPGTTDAFNLGSSTNSWNQLHIGSVYLDGILSLHGTGTNNFFAGKDAGNSILLFGTENTGIGSSVMQNIGGGSKNTATGFNALFSEADGNDNTAIGHRALYSNDDGNDNTAVGSKAMYSNTDGYLNVAIGKSALANNTDGFHMVAIGDSSLFSQGHNSFDEYENVAIGSRALFTNDFGPYNTAVGSQALYSNNIGHDNCSFGYLSLYSNTNGTNNVAVGNSALHDMDLGDFNSAVGTLALANANSVSANYNSAFGNRALYFTTTSDSNTACGAYAGYNNTTGVNNTFLGVDADVSSGNLSNSTAIGYGATVTASNNMVFGKSSVVGWGYGVAPATRAIKVGTSSSNGNGAYLTVGGTWTNTSSREKKEDFQKQDRNSILEKINMLEVTKWKYKGTDNEYHYGPMADDFYRLFEVGDDSSTSDMDKTGVLFMGIQALSEESGKLKIENEELKIENSDQQRQIDELKSEIQSFKSAILDPQSAISDGFVRTQVSPLGGDLEGALLGQNIPNPFDNSTLIPFRIPKDCNDASIMIVEIATSRVVAMIPVACNETHVQVDAGTLASGNYSYTLYVDGMMIETKEMVLTR